MLRAQFISRDNGKALAPVPRLRGMRSVVVQVMSGK